jgi:hypothetical protein
MKNLLSSSTTLPARLVFSLSGVEKSRSVRLALVDGQAVLVRIV